MNDNNAPVKKISLKKPSKKNKCQSTTQKKTQCTRNAVEGSDKCAQHGGKAKELNSNETKALGLPAVPKETQGNVVKKIQRLIQKDLSSSQAKTTAGGYVYIYRLAHETGLNYWKIGMTDREVDKRMKEWEGTLRCRVLCVKEYKLKKNHAYCERLIHLYLDYCRMYRYPAEAKKGDKHVLFKSKWYRSGEWIDDDQGREIDERLVAKNKHVEWFCAPLAEILKVVQAIVAFSEAKL